VTSAASSAAYVGRFAPSPTGSLHFGSLVAALASCCDARSNNGIWRLRIDDIDPPRATPHAAAQFQETLHTYGFQWDGPIIFQSQRIDTYRKRLLQLNDKHKLYPCSCSRRDLGNHSIYPKTCRPPSGLPNSHAKAASAVIEKLSHTDGKHALRVTIDSNVAFNDLIQGSQYLEAGKQLGDTVVVRRDDLFSYSLACAIDDASGISRVVRGADLLPTTAAQISIMQLLELDVPEYAHIPIALNSNSQKLSKQTQAKPIDAMAVLPTLRRAWQALGQKNLDVHSVSSFWQAAIPAWNLHSVPNRMSQSHE